MFYVYCFMIVLTSDFGSTRGVRPAPGDRAVRTSVRKERIFIYSIDCSLYDFIYPYKLY